MGTGGVGGFDRLKAVWAGVCVCVCLCLCDEIAGIPDRFSCAKVKKLKKASYPDLEHQIILCQRIK